MQSKKSRGGIRAETVSTRQRATAEPLEPRRLLSISPASLVGPVNETGTQWTYQINTVDNQTSSFTQAVVGPTTFNGVAATEVDTNLPSGASIKAYDGFDPAGDYVTYGGVAQGTGAFAGETDTVDQPYAISYPASLTAGVPFTETYTEVDTDPSMGVVTTTPKSATITLMSETTTSVTVPAGTYDVYQVQVIEAASMGTGSDGSTSQSDGSSSTFYDAANVGVVKAVDQYGNTTVLTKFGGSQDHLAFTGPPTTTAAGKAIDPAVTVSAEDAANNPDPSATGSVTLTLASASRLGTSPGTLGGTATEPLVGGVATLSDLTVSADGTYVLNATDSDADVAGAPSGKFRIGTSDLTVEITTKLLSKEKGGSLAKGAMPGDRVLYSVLVTPHQTIQTANVVLTLPAGFTPAGITAGGVFAGNTITWTANTRLYDFDLTVPAATTLAGLKQIATSVDDAVTYTDGSTDEATATNAVKLGGADDHLVIRKQPPASADALAPFPVTVALVDQRGKLVTSENAAGVQLSLQTITGGNGAKLAGTTTATFVGGVATFPATAGPAVAGVGTFKLVATETGTDSPVDPVSTGSIKVVGYQYSIAETVHDGTYFDDRLAATNDDVQPGQTVFDVVLHDPKGKQITNLSLPQLQVSLTAVSGTGTYVGDPVVSQLPTFESIRYRVPVDVSTAGTYTFTLTPLDTPGAAVPAGVILPLTTKPIKVFDPVLTGRTYGNIATTPANVAFPLFAGLIFPTGKYIAPLVTTASVGVLLTLTAVNGDGQFSGGTSFPLLPPDRSNRDALASGENIMIDAPGIYRVTFTEAITPGGLPFDPANATPVSGRAPAMTTIRIAPDHLVFMPQPPRTLVAGQPFSVTVAAVDTKGRVLTTFTDQPDQNGLVLEVSISVYTSRTGKTADFAAVPAQTFSDGLVTFDNLTIAAGPLVRLHATLIVYDTFHGFVNDSHYPDAVSLFDRVVPG